MSAALDKLEKLIAYKFKNKALIKDALTHSSTGEETNYERLEFLGDRVLGLVIAQILYDKFPGESEGDLAKRLAALVQGSLLAEIAAQIHLGDYIILSEAERGAGGSAKENILADCFEAMIGAIYLDSGLGPCRAMVENLWSESFFTMKQPPLHPKTRLQEWAQSAGLSLPVYDIINQSGPDHMPVFDVKLSVKGFDSVTGSGRSRQEAEKEAARIFLEKLAEGR
jgi:ribonuclease-3